MVIRNIGQDKGFGPPLDPLPSRRCRGVAFAGGACRTGVGANAGLRRRGGRRPSDRGDETGSRGRRRRTGHLRVEADRDRRRDVEGGRLSRHRLSGIDALRRARLLRAGARRARTARHGIRQGPVAGGRPAVDAVRPIRGRHRRAALQGRTDGGRVGGRRRLGLWRSGCRKRQRSPRCRSRCAEARCPRPVLRATSHRRGRAGRRPVPGAYLRRRRRSRRQPQRRGDPAGDRQRSVFSPTGRFIVLRTDEEQVADIYDLVAERRVGQFPEHRHVLESRRQFFSISTRNGPARCRSCARCMDVAKPSRRRRGSPCSTSSGWRTRPFSPKARYTAASTPTARISIRARAAPPSRRAAKEAAVS